MSIEIRNCTADELRAYADVPAYVFAASPEDYERQIVQGEGLLEPEWTIAAFVDGEIATTLGAYPWQVRVNGQPVSTAAVTEVGTCPGHRRRGLLRRLMTRALEWHHERGQSMAMLWASYGAIYQRFGYGLGSHTLEYRFDPRDVALRDSFEERGAVRLADGPANRATIEAIYHEYAAPRTLVNDRDEWWWDRLWKHRDKQRRYYAIYRDDAGTPRGYMTYTTAEDMDAPFEPGPAQSLDLYNFVPLDLDAHRAMWNFIRSHDLVKEVRFRFAPEDDPIVDMLLEPRALRRRLGDGMWVRIVDVETALAARGYDDDGALTIAVHDDVCPWNDATYRLDVTGGEPRVQRLEAAAGADLTMPVAALASLYSGFRSATHLHRAARLEGDAPALRTADRLFATRYRPLIMDGF